MPVDVVIKKTRKNAEEFYRVSAGKDGIAPEEG